MKTKSKKWIDYQTYNQLLKDRRVEFKKRVINSAGSVFVYFIGSLSFSIFSIIFIFNMDLNVKWRFSGSNEWRPGDPESILIGLMFALGSVAFISSTIWYIFDLLSICFKILSAIFIGTSYVLKHSDPPNKNDFKTWKKLFKEKTIYNQLFAFENIDDFLVWKLKESKKPGWIQKLQFIFNNKEVYLTPLIRGLSVSEEKIWLVLLPQKEDKCGDIPDTLLENLISLAKLDRYPRVMRIISLIWCIIVLIPISIWFLFSRYHIPIDIVPDTIAFISLEVFALIGLSLMSYERIQKYQLSKFQQIRVAYKYFFFMVLYTIIINTIIIAITF